MQQYFIRLGALGEIHLAETTEELQPGGRVIVRTPRGVELAQIVGMGPRKHTESRHRFDDESRGKLPASDYEPIRKPTHRPPNRILRATTEPDELLIRRLERHKRTAIENCRREMAAAGCAATLLDVDQLLDGGTLVMHFLGPVDQVAESITKQIVSEYEKVVRSRHLAKLLHEGCGPGCGEQNGGGCGTSCSSGACAGCGVAKARGPLGSTVPQQN
tara:strand:- start:23383 stop:24033 length:651 start_codon:yes stop_codon:yes gene_type:complete